MKIRLIQKDRVIEGVIINNNFIVINGEFYPHRKKKLERYFGKIEKIKYEKDKSKSDIKTRWYSFVKKTNLIHHKLIYKIGYKYFWNARSYFLKALKEGKDINTIKNEMKKRWNKFFKKGKLQAYLLILYGLRCFKNRVSDVYYINNDKIIYLNNLKREVKNETY